MKKCIYIFSIGLFFFSKSFGQVRPETVRQIQSLLQEKEARTPAQQKMDSRLIQAAREHRGQKMVEGVDLLPANVNADEAGTLKVDINGSITDALLEKIRSLGGEIIFPSKEYRSLRARVNLSDVETIAAFPEVSFIQPAVLSTKVGSKNPKANLSKASVAPLLPKVTTTSNRSLAERKERVKKQIEKYMMVLGTGSVNSQGDHAHRADDARNAYGYSGQGIKVGVLSDSYNATGIAAASVASGNLPGIGNPFGNTTPVTVLQDYAGGEDEGQAMLQIVHDIAPKAQLYFATADVGEAGFATNIKALRAAGCDIIIDDIFYYDEPTFQDGIVAQAVNMVTANGAMYFSSAGNSGALVKGTSGVWEGDFTDVGSLTTFTGSTKAGTIHNFGTATLGDVVTAAASGGYTLGWSDPIGKSGNDYDLFLVSSTGSVKGMSTTIQNGTQNPYEYISTATLVSGDQLVVFKSSTAAIRAISLNTNRGALRVATAGQTHGHACAADAYCVAAAPAAAPFSASSPTGPYPGIFTTASKLETFSSDGPRRIFYNADTTAVTAGNFLFGTNGGLVRNKPDITAADGVSTTLPASSGLNPFYGTSAAAPHAGAIAALLKSANPALTPAQIRTIITTTALDIESAGYDINSGYGIVQAYQAMQLLNPTPLSNITIGTVTETEGSFSNGDGVVEAGELGNLVVQLANPSQATATSVTATITTTTPGITITKGTATYGSIAAAANISNTGSPFTFGVNSSVACGTVITFYMTVNFGGGGSSPQGFVFTETVGSIPLNTISSSLGNTPPTNSNFTSTTGTWTGLRLNRNTPVSSCGVQKTAPVLTSTNGVRTYDAYTFTNTSAVNQCLTVTMTATNGVNLYFVAYNSNGFVPATPNVNFLADQGSSTATQTFNFTDTAGKPYTLVVYNVTPGSGVGSAYTISVSTTNCAAGPACNPIVVSPSSSIINGAAGTAFSQVFSATGGSNSGTFTYSLAGGLPGGLTFSGNTLSGTPTQAGSFPLTLTVNDPTGCSTTMNYTLTIAGDVPTSVATVTGTPQTTYPTSAFSLPLQAIVYDASNVPLSGVNVIFTAPTTGASGTFTGGANTVTVLTNASGVATSPILTANATQGTYIVTATINGVATPANFTLNNVCLATIVTNNADNGPGSLRYIIANACPSSTITFASSVTSIALTSGDIAITQPVTISGTGANLLTISGSNLSRIFNITAGTGTVSISGITIRDGNPQAGATNSTNGGGGVLINSGIVNVSNCIVSNNDASLTSYAEGGGIDNEGGTVTINNCSIINNKAIADGGGIAQWVAATMTVSNSTIANNSLQVIGGSTGGGIFVYHPLILTNCTVYGNTAEYGGNICSNGNTDGSSTITMKNNIIAGGILIGTGAGPDIYGSGYISSDYNLVQTPTNGTITGTVTHNILGVSPKMLPLANYGGLMPTMLPMSSSPVVNVGDPTLVASAKDQRGFSRVIGTSADIGSVETNYASNISSGTAQSTFVSTNFANPLKTSVTESGNAISGDSVYYVAPATGQSGTFPTSSLSATVITDASGIATSPTFMANAIAGTYNVTSSIGTPFTALNFVLTNNLVTPVTFGAITATVINCTAQLQWITLTELNSKNFTVEYSADGLNFTALVTVPSKGNSTTEQIYKYIHTSLAQGTNYYRIKQTDFDGVFTYSSVVIVASDCNNAPIVAYPNPVHNNLTIVIPGTDKRTILITDAIGRKISQYIVNGGTQIINAGSWAKGMYSLTITQDGALSFVMKVIKD